MKLHHTCFILNSSNTIERDLRQSVTVKMFMMNYLRVMEEIIGGEYYVDKEDCILT